MTQPRALRQDMKIVIATIAGACALFGSSAGGQDLNLIHAMTAEASRRVHICAACHGGDGQSTAEIFPSLAGQQKDYLVTQVTAFRDRARGDRDARAYMWGMATGLDDATIDQLATYYAALRPSPGTAASNPEIAAGEKIYKEGITERDIPACAACHGDHAEGNGPMPRLAGQQEDYLSVQLGALASGARVNETMNPIAKTMTPAEIKAVAAYLSSL
jgi:cytochrome c553